MTAGFLFDDEWEHGNRVGGRDTGFTGRILAGAFCSNRDREGPRQIAPRRLRVGPRGRRDMPRANALPRAPRGKGSSPDGAPAVLKRFGNAGPIALAHSASYAPV